MCNIVSYLIELRNKETGETEPAIRVYSTTDRDLAVHKLESYYDKYSGIRVIVAVENTEIFTYKSLEDLLNTDLGV